VIRYLRLYGHFLRFSFSRAMEFRFDFFFRIGMDTLWYGHHLAFFWVLYRHTPVLGGWNLDQMVVFAGGVFLMDAIQMTMTANNTWMLPNYVNKGDLDYYLVRPVSSLFFLSLRDFAANSFINLLMAIGLFSWALARYPGPLGAGSIAMYVGLLLLGTLLHFSLHMIFILPVFWLHTSGGLREVFWSLDRYAQRPHGIFTGWVRRVLVSLLPFALIVSYPTMALFDGLTWTLFLHIAGVAAAAFLVMVWIWTRGLRAYASASS
jgi:ABC-2 type transport system permease protein